MGCKGKLVLVLLQIIKRSWCPRRKIYIHIYICISSSSKLRLLDFILPWAPCAWACCICTAFLHSSCDNLFITYWSSIEVKWTAPPADVHAHDFMKIFCIFRAHNFWEEREARFQLRFHLCMQKILSMVSSIKLEQYWWSCQ